MTDKDSLTAEQRYERAETLLQGFTSDQLVRNDRVFPCWIESSDSFWYERKTQSSNSVTVSDYRLVDASTGETKAAFDHQALAVALSKATKQQVDPEHLPMTSVAIALSPLTIQFEAFGQRWEFNTTTEQCHTAGESLSQGESIAPDGRYVAFVKDFNIWLRDTDSYETWPVTTDGVESCSYGGPNSAWGKGNFIEAPVLWSQGSRRLITVLRDRRHVLTSPIVDHVPDTDTLKPEVHTVTVAYPGDAAVETYQLVSINCETGKVCVADYPPLPSGLNNNLGLFFSRMVWWLQD